MRRTLLVITFAALVVTAGCQTGPFDGGDGSTASPTPTATEPPTATPSPTPSPTPTQSFQELSYPAGASEAGFQNASAVLEEGTAVLNGTSFTVEYAVTRTWENGSSTSASFSGEDGDDRSLTSLEPFDEASGTTSYYVTSSAIITREQGDSGGSYDYSEFGGYASHLYGELNLLIVNSVTQQFLQAFEYEAADSYTEDGHTYVVYESTDVNESFVEQSISTDFASGDLTVTLRDDGVVTAIEGEAVADVEGTTRTTTVDYSVEAIGSTTVTEPAWVDESVTRLEATTIEDGRVVELTHAGGPPIRDAAVTVSRGYVSGDVTLESLSEGESVYLTATENEDSYTLDATVSRDRPTPGENAVDFTAASSTQVEVETDDFSGTVFAHRNESTTGSS